MTTFFAPTPMFGDSSAMFAFAMGEASVSNDYIRQLGVASAALVPPTITPQFPVGYIPPAISIPAVPATQQIIWTVPATPSIFSGTIDITGVIPEFDTLPPVVNMPTPPSAFTQVVPPTPGVDLNFKYPDLSVTLHTPPDLLSLDTYQFNGVNLPVIDATIPQLTLVAPTLVPYKAPTLPYSDTLMDTVRAVLIDRIKNGTNTGLPPAVEQALWDRAREREMIASADAIAELERMEALGYAFPPGVYTNARLKIQTDMGYTTAGLSREVAIKQAELIQKTISESIGQAVEVEKIVVDYANHVEQLMFESCKYATEAGISIYNSQIKSYEATVEAYKAKIAYFDAQVREQEAAVNIYRTEVEAEKLKSDMNTALVHQYETMAKVAEINVDIYKAELEGIRLKADTQKIIVEIFGEQIKAYVAQVNAYTSQVEAYRAQLQGIQTQEQIYKTEVEAYSTLVGAAKAQIDARVDVLKANATSNATAWEGYKALVSAQAEQARAIALSNTSVADIYRAQTSGLSAYNETLTKQWNVSLEQAERVAEVGVSAAKANAELYMTTRSLALDAAKVGAQVSAQLGAAGVSAINWSTHYSYGLSNSVGVNENISSQTSTSQIQEHILSENYNF